MKKTDSLKGLRISRAAIAKIIWNAIASGADSNTLRAIRDYIASPSSPMPRDIDSAIYLEAVAETDRAERRSRKAREAAARRRRDSGSPPHTPTQQTSAPADTGTEVKKIKKVVRKTPVVQVRPEYLRQRQERDGTRGRKKVRKLTRPGL